ncbi:RipA family octameric membrane protein [Ruegeria arenilitoris]|uniref:RipA family octameric membrane protein n=1 Tax=Ruegeria arenilitoris TaxID=1173585 RepID=UPI00147A26A0|nr:hypothetical protein [Ruegeria arenilitoris]
MTDETKETFELYKLYLATAEKVSDRRNTANVWMLSVNSAVISLYGYLSSGKASVDDASRLTWQWAIPLAGILICIAWQLLLRSYGQLNAAKFTVLQEMEVNMDQKVFTDEWAHLESNRRRDFHKLEGMIPMAFACLYILLLGAALL